MATIAEIVNEWFQAEPTPERQQNMRRMTLIADLRAQVDTDLRAAHSDGYTEGYRDGVIDEEKNHVDPCKTLDGQGRPS